MKTRYIIPVIFFLLAFFSCRKEPLTDANRNVTELAYNQVQNSSGHVKIAIISDLHFMSPSLFVNGGENGYAFQYYLAKDPKLIQYSVPIMTEVVKLLKAENPDIVLVNGDLTKDGEKVSHQEVIPYLQQLANANIKVYVVPGNHDINNPDAVYYVGNGTTPAEKINAQQFATLYANFGYANAISKDSYSLSYIAEAKPGLWIMSIDDNKYDQNTSTTLDNSGAIKPQTMQWIHDRMLYANSHNIAVIPFMHHGLVEHYQGQNMFDPGYVTDNWEATADAFISDGLKVMFTGHYHATDITPRYSSNGVIYDIETGSTVTTPSPYRIVMLKNKELEVKTFHITNVDASFPNNMSFMEYGKYFYSAHLDNYFSYALTQQPFGLDPTVAVQSAPLFRDAFMAHVAGDEKISPNEQRLDNNFAGISQLGAMALQGLWTDLGLKDNDTHFKIGTP